MSQLRVRRVAAMIVVVVLALALPTAQARTLARTPATTVTATSWLAAFANWAAGLFTQTATGKPSPVATSAASLTGIGIDSNPKAHPNTGSCIDPEGRTIPCNQ